MAWKALPAFDSPVEEEIEAELEGCGCENQAEEREDQCVISLAFSYRCNIIPS